MSCKKSTSRINKRMNRLIYILFLGVLLFWSGCTPSNKMSDPDVRTDHHMLTPIRLNNNLSLNGGPIESNFDPKFFMLSEEAEATGHTT